MKEKLVFGVGVTDIPVKLNGKPERTYQLWTGILCRCYSERKHKTHPSYADCSVDDRWLIYSNFKQDVQKMVGFENETWSLDKDILEKGNKVYCLDKCAFVPRSLNNLLTNCRKRRGEYPVGVNKNPKKKLNPFDAKCNDGTGKRLHLGCFSNQDDAFQAYKKFKENLIKRKAQEHKNEIDIRVFNALMNYQVEVTD